MSDDTPDTHVDNVEPSMEDILSSIRRIIADEDGAVALDAEEAASVAEVPTVVEFNKDEAESASVDSLSESTDVFLDELESDTVLESLDVELNEIDLVEQSLTELGSIEDPKAPLSGLGAVAAASFGALASAGAATADSIAEARNNPRPSPEPIDPVSDVKADSIDETLDLLLADDESLSDPDLDEWLKIPDVNETAEVDDIDALLGNLLTDENVTEELVTTEVDADSVSHESVIDPAADLIEPHDGQDANVLSDEDLLADLLGAEAADEVDSILDSELPAPEIASPELSSPELPSSVQSEDDLSLMKSLMADLTGHDSLETETEASDSVEAEASVDAETPIETVVTEDAVVEVAEADIVTTIEAQEAPAEADLVDDILSLSIGDEVALQTETVAPEPEAVEAVAEETAPEVPGDVLSEVEAIVTAEVEAEVAAETTRTSLTDIAQAAEAEADSVERRASLGAAGVAAAVTATALVGANQGDEAVVSEADLQANIEITAETTPQVITQKQETADMPKAAAQKDAIIDTVTEEAAVGAFASLNQVVENKAAVADRGDRIGDLVQEALRPMLKEWLDKNLKGIVERAVTKEVKRISTGK